MNVFIEQFITKGGYKTVLSGLLVTVEIAVFGLIIGILLGTVIAVVRVTPKYKIMPKITTYNPAFSPQFPTPMPSAALEIPYAIIQPNAAIPVTARRYPQKTAAFQLPFFMGPCRRNARLLFT